MSCNNQYSSFNMSGDFHAVWGRPSSPTADEQSPATATEQSSPIAAKSPDSSADGKEELNPDSHASKARLGGEHWYLEISSLILSTIVLVCLFYMLFRIDGHPTTYWHLPMTTGATLAIGVLLFEIFTLFPVSTCVGQLKWIKYKRRPRSLAEIQMYDDASRGSVGGTFKIALGRGGFFAAFGVVTMLLAGAIGPFTQQVLKTPSRYVPTGQPASVVRTLSYTEWYGTNFDNPQLPLVMKAAINDGLYGYIANSPPKDPYHLCPAGNCTFETFYNLGVCSQCADVSSQLNVSGDCITLDADDCKYELPSVYGNFSLARGQLPSSMINVSTLNNFEGVIPSPESSVIEFVTINATASSATNTTEISTATAWHCKLLFCIQGIDTQVINGVFSQNVWQAYSDVKLTYGTPYDEGIDTHETYNLTIPGNDTFTTTSFAWYPLSQYLRGIFSGASYVPSALDLYHPTFFSDSVQAIWQSGDVSGIADSVALSISTRMREAPSVWPNPNPISTEVVPGISHHWTPYFYVDWVWMIAALVAMVFAWLFVCSVIEMTRWNGARLWKTSVLPLLFHGLCDGAKTNYNSAADGETLQVMEKHAEKIAVQFREFEGPSLLVHDADYSKVLKAKKRFSSLSMLAPSYEYNSKDDYEEV